MLTLLNEDRMIYSRYALNPASSETLVRKFLNGLRMEMRYPEDIRCYELSVDLFRRWKSIYYNTYGKICAFDVEWPEVPLEDVGLVTQTLLDKYRPTRGEPKALVVFLREYNPLNLHGMHELLKASNVPRRFCDAAGTLIDAEYGYEKGEVDIASWLSKKVLQDTLSKQSIEDSLLYLAGWALHIQGKVSTVTRERRNATRLFDASLRVKEPLAWLPSIMQLFTEVHLYESEIEESPDRAAEQFNRLFLALDSEKTLGNENLPLRQHAKLHVLLGCAETSLAQGQIRKARTFSKKAVFIADETNDLVNQVRALLLLYRAEADKTGPQMEDLREKIRNRIGSVADHPRVRQALEEIERQFPSLFGIE